MAGDTRNDCGVTDKNLVEVYVIRTDRGHSLEHLLRFYNYDFSRIRIGADRLAVYEEEAQSDETVTQKTSTQELCSDAEIAARTGRPLSGTVEYDGVESAVSSTPDEEKNHG